MKPTKHIKLAKTVRCVYLYADKHAVLVHEERVKGVSFQHVEIIERLDVSCAFQGRIVFHYPYYDSKAELALNAYQVCMSEASTEQGSENTKKAGIRIGSFTIYAKHDKGAKSLHWTRVPDLISDGLTYQPENTDIFNAEMHEGGQWGTHTISKIHRVERKTEEAVAA